MKYSIKIIRAVLLILLAIFTLSGESFAEVIILKSGKKIEGKIIERKPGYIKVDFYGTPLTYYKDQIERIEGDSVDNAVDEEYQVFCDKARAFFKQGSYDEALTQLEQAVNYKPDYPQAHNDIGLIYACRNDYPRAIEEFKKALVGEFGDYSTIIRWNLAVVYCLDGQLEEANILAAKLSDFNLASLLAVAIQMKEKKTNVFYTISASSFPPDTVAFAPTPEKLGKEVLEQIRQKQDREMQVSEDKTYVVENFPLLFLYHSPLSYLNLAQTYITSLNYPDAKRCLDDGQKNIENMQDYLDRVALAGIYFFRGKIYLDEKDYPRAEKNFKLASGLFPKWHVLHTFTGVSYYMQGKYDEAKDEFKTSLRILGPDSSQAKEIKGYLEEIENIENAARGK